MNDVNLIVTPSQLSAATAAGLTLKGVVLPLCSLAVGDLIASSEAPGLFYRVTQRLFHAKPPPERSQWFVWIEPAENPFAGVLLPPEESRPA